jgi:hypothetical protein
MQAAERAPGRRLPRLRLGAALALAVAAGTTAWILTTPADHSDRNDRTAAAAGARIVSLTELKAAVTAAGGTSFWAGPRRAGQSYELTTGTDGRVFLRYLATGAHAGDPRAGFLTVATYPQANAFAQVEAAGRRPGASTFRLPDGALAVYDRARPTNVFVAYADLDRQVEVYHPSSGEARRLVRSGAVRPIIGATWSGKRAVSVAGLLALARRQAGQVFWAGPRPRRVYELTLTPDGRTYVRYLPHGASLGDPRPDFLAIGTYPQQDAYAQLHAAVRRRGAVALALPHGGLAVYDRARPTSVYVAYPRSGVQVEVYSPAPGEARRLVESGRVRPAG